VLFVVSNPIVPALALVSSYVEIRGDGFKLLRIHRRVEPGGVEVRGGKRDTGRQREEEQSKEMGARTGWNGHRQEL
jgi:hypothetical protein